MKQKGEKDLEKLKENRTRNRKIEIYGFETEGILVVENPERNRKERKNSYLHID